MTIRQSKRHQQAHRFMAQAFCAAVTLVILPSTVLGQNIDTFAGTGTKGYGGDGGPALSALFAKPSGIAVGANGDVYIADKDNKVIRKVDVATGIISTIAGGGVLQIGDGNLATAAWLNKPQGVAVDTSGNLYVADTDNQRIRKISTSSGIMSTLAGDGTKGFGGDGGPAVNAIIQKPKGIAVDSSGNVIFADTDNHRIRKISTGGIITTIAGTGAKGYGGDGGPAVNAILKKPQGLSIDSAGNIFFADTDNHRIRKISTSGTISTVAGNGTKGFSGDGGAATAAKLSKPRSVWVDSAGNLYIADTDNQRIRKVTSGGTISTIAGTGVKGYSGDGSPATSAMLRKPEGVAVNSAGDVFIVDKDNQRIRKIKASNGIISTYAGTGVKGYSGDGGPATSAAINKATAVTVDGSGNVFIADTDNHIIRKILSSNQTIITVAGKPQDNGIGDGGPATSAFLDKVEDVEIDLAGNLYIVSSKQNRVRKVTAATGLISTIMGAGSDVQPELPGDDLLLFGPTGIGLDTSGNLYVADKNNHMIRKLTVATNTYATIAGTGLPGFSGDGGSALIAMLRKPNDVAVDNSGNVFIADTDNHRIRRIDAATGAITTYAGNGTSGYSGDGGPATAAMIKKPKVVRVDKFGVVYIGQTDSHVIRKVLTDGTITTIAGTGTAGSAGDGGPATAAQLKKPLGIGFKMTDSSLLYIGDTDNQKVRVIQTIINVKRIMIWREVPNQAL